MAAPSNSSSTTTVHTHHTRNLSLNLQHVQGIIFDMDDTLIHSKINYDRLRQRIGPQLLPHMDIIQYTLSIKDTQQQQQIWQIIEDEERIAAENCIFSHGLFELMHFIQSRNIRIAMVTRNSAAGVNGFLSTLASHAHNNHIQIEFDIILDRHSTHGLKPSPAPATHIIQHVWKFAPEQVLFVGDEMNDVYCGHGAGCHVALIKREHNTRLYERRRKRATFQHHHHHHNQSIDSSISTNTTSSHSHSHSHPSTEPQPQPESQPESQPQSQPLQPQSHADSELEIEYDHPLHDGISVIIERLDELIHLLSSPSSNMNVMNHSTTS